MIGERPPVPEILVTQEPPAAEVNPNPFVPFQGASSVTPALIAPLPPSERLNPAPTVLIVTVIGGVVRVFVVERTPIFVLPVEMMNSI